MKKAYYIVIGIIVLLFFTKDIDLNNKDYDNISLVTDPLFLDVLVNKNNQLQASFAPFDLVLIDSKYSHNGKMLRKEAALAFEKLSSEAQNLGYRIVAVSAYRDYDYQKNLFNYYVSEKGLDYALECSARPGFSEHQTGLAVDVEGTNRDYDHFDEADEFEWMKNNAHKYGFILRYPKGKEKITKFKYEPWHYRYVGESIATYIYENNLTLEEYLKSNK